MTPEPTRPTGPPAASPPLGFGGTLANLLEREAGHVVVSLLLMGIGAALWVLKIPKAEDLIPFATGVLARSMVGHKQSNQR